MAAFDEHGDAQLARFQSTRHGGRDRWTWRMARHYAVTSGCRSGSFRRPQRAGHRYSLCYGGKAVDRERSKSPLFVSHSKTTADSEFQS